MENVKGLLSSKVDGKKIFQMIKQDLQDPSIVFKDSKFRYKGSILLPSKPIGFYENGYPVYEKDMDYLIKSEDYGVPQRRHRVILLGIREDIKVDPDILTPVDDHGESRKDNWRSTKNQKWN